MYATFAGHEIPKVYEVQESEIHLGESARTAGGKLRRDSSGLKLSWAIKCRAAPRSQVEPLLNHLRSTFYAEGAFWLRSFGTKSNTVQAMVDPKKLGVKSVLWNEDWVELSLTVEEV